MKTTTGETGMRPSPGGRPLVTLAMPVFNVSRYVIECLASIAALEVPAEVDVELLIIDDCSTDDSMLLVERFLAAPTGLMPARVVRHDSNRGLAEARNTALANARGDFLWFIDSDDRVAPVMLRHLWAAVDQSVDVVMTDVMMVSEDGVTALGSRIHYGADRRWTGGEALAEFYRRRIPAFMWNKLFRVSVLEGIVFPPGRIYEDLAVLGQILSRAREVRFVASTDYLYRIRPGALTAELRPNIRDLVTSVRWGIEETEALVPLPVRASVIREFLLREALLPVLNAAARAPGADRRLRSAVYGEVRAQLSVRSALTLASRGRLTAAAAEMIARMSPRAYGAVYRALRGVGLN